MKHADSQVARVADADVTSLVTAGVRRVLVIVAMIAAILAPIHAGAQSGGRIVGRVIDSETGRGLVGAMVSLQDSRAAVISGVDGRYTLSNVPTGPLAVTAMYLGYATKTVTDVVIPASGSLSLDITLVQTALEMEGITVSVGAEQGTVSRALDEQRTAVGVISAVTSEQISRSPDSDAAAAVRRVSGVTVQDGKNVFVRGLGERYTVTTLNGSRVPSPEPEKRAVPLDLFPTALLQSVTTIKTFTPNLSGDFGGAQVNIATREFRGARRLTFSFSGGLNNRASWQEVLVAPTLGRESITFGAGNRSAPAAVASPAAVRQLTTEAAMQDAVRQLRYDVRPQIGTGIPNGSLGFSVGGQDPILGRDIGYIGSITYALSQEVRDREVRANPIFRDGEFQVLEQWTGSTGLSSATLGGMLNLNTYFSDNHRLALNNSYTRTMDNEAREDYGYTNYFQVDARRSTTRYVERLVRSNQLAGEHAFGQQQNLRWNVTTSGVSRREPDRVDMVYVRYQGPTGAYLGLPVGDPEGMRRTFGDLTESSHSAGADYTISRGSLEASIELKFGGLYRYTARDATNFQFSVFPEILPQGANAGTPSEIFRLTEADGARFRIAGSNEAGSYAASEHLSAGYAMVEFPLGPGRLITGARLEHQFLTLDTDLVGGARSRIEQNLLDVLPSVVYNVGLGGSQTLRLSATQTLARPEYRELSPFAYLEVIGGEITKGNAGLQRSLIRNFDVKWEAYPESDEVLSVNLFAKQFVRPIERIDVSTGGPPQVTFVNAEGAFTLGAELEARVGLERIGLEPWSIISNVTLMHSRIDVGEGVSANTNSSRPMIGQAPYVVNAGVNYTNPNSASATLLYNVVGKRIWAAGSIPFPDIYEMERHMLDLSVRVPLRSATTLRLDARNLLNAPTVLRQGPVDRQWYHSGRVFSLGVNWQPAL